MLSAALQLRLPEDDRRVQGHHRLNSTRLYGRDDTHQALWVQRRLAEAIAKLWRPQRPMARGGQHPMAEPPFQVPADPPPAGITLAALPPALERFIYTRESELQTSAPDVTLDKESGSESDSAPSEGQSSEGEPLPDPTEEPPGAPGLPQARGPTRPRRAAPTTRSSYALGAASMRRGWARTRPDPLARPTTSSWTPTSHCVHMPGFCKPGHRRGGHHPAPNAHLVPIRPGVRNR